MPPRLGLDALGLGRLGLHQPDHGQVVLVAQSLVDVGGETAEVLGDGGPAVGEPFGVGSTSAISTSQS